MDSRTLLASIVQGEASSVAGQQAVLNVIQNRAAQNFGGYGTDLLAQATAPRQFSAYPNALQTPSPFALSMTDRALAGTLPNIVPQSLNYGNPFVPGVSPWLTNAYSTGTGVNIGGNYFFANSQGGAPGYDPSKIFGAEAPQDGPGSGFAGSGLDTGGPAAGLTGGGPAPVMDAQGNYHIPGVPDVVIGGATGSQTGMMAPGQGADAIPTNTAASDNGLIGDSSLPGVAGLQSVAKSAPAATGGGLVGGGPPVFITDASAIGENSGAKVQTGLNALGQSVGQSTVSAITAGTSWLGSLETTATDLLIRGGLIALALVVLIGAWLFYSVEGRPAHA